MSTGQQDWVDPDIALTLLQERPEGLTVREVAAKLETSYTAAQNALRKLFARGDAEYTRPTRITEDKRWRAADD